MKTIHSLSGLNYFDKGGIKFNFKKSNIIWIFSSSSSQPDLTSALEEKKAPVLALLRPQIEIFSTKTGDWTLDKPDYLTIRETVALSKGDQHFYQY